MSKMKKIIFTIIGLIVLVIVGANQVGKNIRSDFDFEDNSATASTKQPSKFDSLAESVNNDTSYSEPNRKKRGLRSNKAKWADPGIEESKKEEFNKTKILAQNGDAEAQFKLGKIYSGRWRTSGSRAEAASWFRKAAEQGDAKAEYELGNSYANGWGVLESDADAARWFSKSAKQGNSNAQFKLGQYYLSAQGVPYNETEAKNWLRKSADQGNIDAQYDLGFFYESAKYNQINLVLAYHYYSLAAAQGHQTGKSSKSRVFGLLDSSQIVEVEKLSIK